MTTAAELDAMTKDELLAYAEEQGVSATASMTKADIRAAIDAGSGAAPDQQVTTTFTKDYLGRHLTNAVPGTSNATDHLGRNVVTGNKDFAGRSLVA